MTSRNLKVTFNIVAPGVLIIFQILERGVASKTEAGESKRS